MVINVLWQVFTRYVTGDPSAFTDELARYLMIWIGVLGAAYVSGKNMHVAIDILPSRANPKTRKKLKILVTVLVILFVFFALVIGGSRLVYISYILGQQSPALQIPLAVVYFILPISGLLIMYYKIADLRNLRS
jgi:TRAP-type C4-dicarboxylate transport system permease small subunit